MTSSSSSSSSSSAALTSTAAASSAAGSPPVARLVATPSLRSRIRPARLIPDLVGTALLACVMVWEYATPALDDGVRRGSMSLSFALSCVMVASVAVRRIWPLTALGIDCAAIGVPVLFTQHFVPFWSGFAPAIFLVYTVARHRPPRIAVLGAGILLAALLVSLWRTAPPDGVNDVVFLLTFEVFVLAFGITLQRTAAQRQQLAHVLARLEDEQLSRERLAVADERVRLARDLHDVVAHAVSLMLVQAGAARLSIHDDPAVARQFLGGVADAGRHASDDLAHLLDLLRATGGARETDSVPGLAAIEALVAQTRNAGLDARLETIGSPPLLEPGLDAAAFRVVQEALTNVLKHAGPTRVVVQIDYRGPILITVEDDGPNGHHVQPLTSGHGLVGMSERAALFGGTIDAGPAGGGFRVRAILPIVER